MEAIQSATAKLSADPAEAPRALRSAQTKWRDAFCDTFSGPWIVDIVWNPLDRLRRVGKALLEYLARLVPGHEPEPSPVSKIARSFREIRFEPRRSEGDKPESRPPKAA